MSQKSKFNTLPRPSASSVIKDDEEVEVPEEQPVLPKPPSSSSDAIGKLRAKLESRKTTNVSVSLDPMRVHGNVPVNQTLTEKNAPRVETKINAKKRAQNYPYLVLKTDFEGADLCLWDVDSARIQLRIDPEMEIVIDGKVKEKGTIDGNRGYVFYKKTKSHVDKLDEIFNGEWRQFLKEPLPEITERNPEYIWTGTVKDKIAELVEYDHKSIVLFTRADLSELTKVRGILHGTSFARPGGIKDAGYWVEKGSQGDAALRNVVPVKYEEFYKQSLKIAPKGVPTGPVFMDKRTVEIEDGTTELCLYDYTPASFAIVFNPDLDVGEDTGLKRMEELRINGQSVPGYVFPKANKTVRATILEIAPDLNFETAAPVIIEDPKLAMAIPAAGARSDSLDDLALRMLSMIGKETGTRTLKSRGKTVIVGNVDDVRSRVDGRPLLMECFVGDKTLIVLKTDE
jgi:hypothetical protein